MNDVGPHFDYRRAPRLFGGREGVGPLEVAWDTLLVIDYFDYGRLLWEGEPVVIHEPRLADEINALQALFVVWQCRDLRFRVLDATLTDARRPMPPKRLAQFNNALIEFAGAAALDGWDDEPPRSFVPSQGAVDAALAAVPQGGDRRMVGEAIERGAHVYLTRDDKVCRAAPLAAAAGLAVLRPTELLDELAACGALDVLSEPRSIWWPAPDLQRLSRLIASLPG